MPCWVKVAAQLFAPLPTTAGIPGPSFGGEGLSLKCSILSPAACVRLYDAAETLNTEFVIMLEPDNTRRA